jgi:hypothetical protein
MVYVGAIELGTASALALARGSPPNRSPIWSATPFRSPGGSLRARKNTPLAGSAIHHRTQHNLAINTGDSP